MLQTKPSWDVKVNEFRTKTIELKMNDEVLFEKKKSFLEKYLKLVEFDNKPLLEGNSISISNF